VVSDEDIEELLASLEANYLGWSDAMAPVIMGNPEQPELGEELKNSFCATDPDMARIFARTTFLSDSRRDLKSVRVPTLVLECTQDVIAPREVGAFVHQEIAGSTLVTLEATGHCPHLSAPEATNDALTGFPADLRCCTAPAGGWSGRAPTSLLVTSPTSCRNGWPAGYGAARTVEHGAGCTDDSDQPRDPSMLALRIHARPFQ
jgi:hypothetical protein